MAKFRKTSDFLVEHWPISRPKPYPKNARKWSARAIEKVAVSIREFGWRQPLVCDAADVIIIGHLRLAAAQYLEGRGELQPAGQVPVHVARDLSPAKVRALRLADNRLHEEAAWDEDLLRLDLATLDLDSQVLTGFNDFELLRLTGVSPGDVNEIPVPETDPAVLQAKWKTASGQVWNVGRHSLIIGDSSEVEVSGDGVCTDPPFDMAADQCAAILRRLTPISVVLCGSKLGFGLAKYLEYRLDFIWKHGSGRSQPQLSMPVWYHAHCIVLSADSGEPTGWRIDMPIPEHEHVLVFSSDDQKKTEWSRRTPGHGSVIETQWYSSDADGEHFRKHTLYTKPLTVFIAMLSGFAGWRRVIDPFSGYGGVLLACDQTGRDCTAIEIDPAAAAVSLERFTGAGLAPACPTLR